MKGNKFVGILVVVILSFLSFNRDVYAAQTLTCVYEENEDQLLFTQNSKGKLTFYKKEKNKDWHKAQVKHWNDNSDSTLVLDEYGHFIMCPKSYNSPDNDGAISFRGAYGAVGKLIDEKNKVEAPKVKSNNKKIPKLTCIYKKGNTAKVAITQNSAGDITIYKNSEDVAYNDKKSYWTVENPNVDWADSTGYNTNNYLLECPRSQTTAEGLAGIGNLGGLTFYGDGLSGKNAIEISFNEVKKFTIMNSQSTDVDIDVKKNVGKSCSQLTTAEKWVRQDYSGYTQSCLYQHTIEENGEKWCHTIQVNIGNSGTEVLDSEKSRNDGKTHNIYSGSLTIHNSIESDATDKGMCPAQLMVTRNSMLEEVITTVSYGGTGTPYNLVPDDGARGESLTIKGLEVSSDFTYNIQFNSVSIATCDELFSSNEELREGLKTLVNVVKILIPIVLIVLGALDFAQAVFASNEDQIKKAQSKFIKRVIIAVAIFLIPTFLKAILGIASSVWNFIPADLCGII